ncbi:MAG TPA: hypothetical protein VGM06_05540 [Polyangiaceae bacterium]|jgi:hypothetical protein
MSTAKDDLARAQRALAANGRAAAPLDARVMALEKSIAQTAHELEALDADAAKAVAENDPGTFTKIDFSSRRHRLHLAEDRVELAKATDAANAVGRRRPELQDAVYEAMSLVIKDEHAATFAGLAAEAQRLRIQAARVIAGPRFVASLATPQGEMLATGERAVGLLRLAASMPSGTELGRLDLTPSGEEIRQAVAYWAARAAELTSAVADEPHEMAAE